MKNSGTTIVFVIVCIVILLASYGIGLCIREARFQHAAVASKADAQPQVSQESTEVQKPSVTVQPANEPVEVTQAPSEARPMPGNEGRMPFGGLSEEERAKMRQNWQNMSDEERAQERERRRAEMRQMREKMQNMSEEEREKYMAEMRQRFGDRQFPGRRGSRGQQQGEE
jgi:hypothetical protein